MLETQCNTWESTQRSPRMQSSNPHPKEHPPEWGVHQRDDLGHLYRTVIPGLCLPLNNYLVLSFTPDQTPGPPVICVHIFGSRWILKQGMVGRLSRLIMAWHPFPFWPRGHVYLGSPWPWGWEVCDYLGLLSKPGLAPLLILSLPLFNTFTEDKYQLFLFLSWIIDRWLVVKGYSGAHLALSSGSFNKRPVVNVYPGAHCLLSQNYNVKIELKE